MNEGHPNTDQRIKEIFRLFNDVSNAVEYCKRSRKDGLPEIAIIGSASSGKSTILENLVGKKFLPRRDCLKIRPLIVDLVQDGSKNEIYGYFTDNDENSNLFDNFDDIRDVIEEKTTLRNYNTAKQSGLSILNSKPLRLTIHSPNFPNLTVIDLPEIPESLGNDQNSEFGDAVEDMINFYIGQHTSIILAVSPAESDVNNSSAIRLAKNADRNGQRTIGVLTKLDTTDNTIGNRVQVFQSRVK